uniref:Sortilin N-terminal domain-containing protein n=1 Tax=Mycobacterium sp. S65 TaxID=214016 RepID=Q716X3_9MYCO|nr:unknown [Mycobacterium sp. S65]
MVVAATSRGVFTVSGDGKARAWPELPGQVMAMAVQDERVAVAVHKHGVFLATAGADHWTDLGDGLAHRDVRALAFDPHTPNALYAGTEPAHLLRWQDGIWAECGNVLGVPEAKRWSFPIRPGIAHVRTIAVHPLEADVVYVGIEVGSLLITRDRGQTWEEIDGLGHDIHRVVLHPEAPDRLIVTTGQDTKPLPRRQGHLPQHRPRIELGAVQQRTWRAQLHRRRDRGASRRPRRGVPRRGRRHPTEVGRSAPAGDGRAQRQRLFLVAVQTAPTPRRRRGILPQQRRWRLLGTAGYRRRPRPVRHGLGAGRRAH